MWFIYTYIYKESDWWVLFDSCHDDLRPFCLWDVGVLPKFTCLSPSCPQGVCACTYLTLTLLFKGVSDESQKAQIFVHSLLRSLRLPADHGSSADVRWSCAVFADSVCWSCTTGRHQFAGSKKIEFISTTVLVRCDNVFFSVEIVVYYLYEHVFFGVISEILSESATNSCILRPFFSRFFFQKCRKNILKKLFFIKTLHFTKKIMVLPKNYKK